MTLTRHKVYHRTGRYAWTWIYRLEGIPKPVHDFQGKVVSKVSHSEGSKSELLYLAKRKYPNEPIINKTKS